jgi:hypothetical protein
MSQHNDEPYATLTAMKDGSLMFLSSYDPALVAGLKEAVPWRARKWDPDQKAWFIDASYGQAVADLAQQHLGVSVAVPRAKDQEQSATRLIRLEYLGLPKDRGQGFVSLGWADGGWTVAIPLPVLKRWFGGETTKPEEYQTLYAVLGVPRTADAQTLKTGYRRAARTWHPDVNHEPDAKEQFQCIQHAYEVLSDSGKRARYDAGLRLEGAARQAREQAKRMGKDLINGYASGFATASVWRPPVRCGNILVVGTQSLGRTTVEKILAWNDIIDDKGRTMVTFWPPGADHFETIWRK